MTSGQPTENPQSFTWRHVLYRLFNSAGELLYIGITQDLNARFSWHAGHSPWWPEVADCRTEFLPSRAELQAAELKAIDVERPRYNKLGMPKPDPQPKPKDRRARKVSSRAERAKDLDARLREKGLRRSSKDPTVFINRHGFVLKPDGGQWWVICQDPALISTCPKAGHERCTEDLTGRHRCRVYDDPPPRPVDAIRTL